MPTNAYINFSASRYINGLRPVSPVQPRCFPGAASVRRLARFPVPGGGGARAGRLKGYMWYASRHAGRT